MIKLTKKEKQRFVAWLRQELEKDSPLANELQEKAKTSNDFGLSAIIMQTKVLAEETILIHLEDKDALPKII